MSENMPELIAFLLEAKRKTYAGNGEHAPSSRPASVDLPYRSGDYYYLDSYLGGLRFAGEEAVWCKSLPLWSMNYYGYMLVPDVPDGFGEFLKQALLAVEARAPFRGPAFYQEGNYEYRCEWEGTIAQFEGRETIWLDKQPIYELLFHGGTIQ